MKGLVGVKTKTDTGETQSSVVFVPDTSPLEKQSEVGVFLNGYDAVSRTFSTATIDLTPYATTLGKLSQFASTTSAELAGVISDENGSGKLVFAAGTLAIASTKTFTSSNTITLAATDGSTLNIGTGGTLGSNAFTSTAYAPLASPTFTGTVTLPASTSFTTPVLGVATGTSIALTADLSARTATVGPVAFASAKVSPTEGTLQAFTDSSTDTWGDVITGGGAFHVLGYYNGTNWTVGAK